MVDDVGLIALIISLVALAVALLQLLQQYLSTTAFNKVNSGALGTWPTRKRLKWSTVGVKFVIRYVRPSLDLDTIYTTRSDAENNTTRSYPPKVRASWCNMMIDLGLDLETAAERLRTQTWEDADTIPSSLETPTMSLQFKDLILCGLLLGMTVSKETKPEKHKIEMAGISRGIFTYRDNNLGPVSRYWGLSFTDSRANSCLMKWEKMDFYTTAVGILSIRGRSHPLPEWNDNEVRAAFDIHVQYGKSWTAPHLLLFAFCDNPAATGAFPRVKFLTGGEAEMKSSKLRTVCEHAFRRLETEGVCPTTPKYAEDFFVFPPKKPQDTGQDQIGEDWISWKLDQFRLRGGYDYQKDGYDYQRDGWRSWLTFKHHKLSSHRKYQFPILSELYQTLREGNPIDMDWAMSYNDKQKGTSIMTANELLWLQITLLDASIGIFIDQTLKPTGAPGSMCSRLSFTETYLKLTGSSLMFGDTSSDIDIIHNQHGYTSIDAALSFRAVLLATRLQLMRDSSLLLLPEALNTSVLVS